MIVTTDKLLENMKLFALAAVSFIIIAGSVRAQEPASLSLKGLIPGVTTKNKIETAADSQTTLDCYKKRKLKRYIRDIEGFELCLANIDTLANQDVLHAHAAFLDGLLMNLSLEIPENRVELVVIAMTEKFGPPKISSIDKPDDTGAALKRSDYIWKGGDVSLRVSTTGVIELQSEQLMEALHMRLLGENAAADL